MPSIFVGNLLTSIKENELIDLFSEFGKCTIDLKEHYAFIFFNTKEEAKEAIKKYNNTNLGGLNRHNKVRVEFSKNNPKMSDTPSIEEQNNNNNYSNIIDINEDRSMDNNISQDEMYMDDKEDKSYINGNNVCYLCKLHGHFGKECILSRDSCYECGIKGHVAKECQAGIREAKNLTYNRVRAIFNQQNTYRYITDKKRFRMFINELKNDNKK